MKSAKRIEAARNKIAATIKQHHESMSQDQKTLLAGMSVALCWVADAGGSTLQRLLDGAEVVAGTTIDDVADRVPEWLRKGF